MWMTKWWMLVSVGLLWAAIARADELMLYSGVGVSHSGKSAIYSIGYTDVLLENLNYRLDLGSWTDSRVDYLTSPFASAVMGPKLGDPRELHFETLAGIAVIGYPDVLLGSNFQFTEEGQIGYNRVAVGYKHFSNAGIIRPNVGRDYVILTVSLPLF